MQVKEAESKFDNVEIVGGLQMTFVLSFMHFCSFQMFYKEHVSLLYLEEKMNITFFREKKCDVQRATEQDGSSHLQPVWGRVHPCEILAHSAHKPQFPRIHPPALCLC